MAKFKNKIKLENSGTALTEQGEMRNDNGTLKFFSAAEQEFASASNQAGATVTHVLTSNGDGTSTYAAPSGAEEHTYQLTDVGLAASPAAGALTLNLKRADGSTDPSGGAPSKITFRSTTITSGAVSTQSYTVATAVTLSSGSTLGYANGDDVKLYIYALYDGSNKEIGVSRVFLDESALHAVTAEGGAGAADDNATLYGPNARGSAAIRLLGRVDIDALTTAGTWTAATAIALNQAYKSIELPVRFSAVGHDALSIAAAANGDIIFRDTGNSFVDSASAYNSSTGVYTVVIDGSYAVSTSVNADKNVSEIMNLIIDIDAVTMFATDYAFVTSNIDENMTIPTVIIDLMKGQTISINASNPSGASCDVTATNSQGFFTIRKV